MGRMSNQELGRRIGVTHSMASRIRNGERLPGTQTLYRIHQELGIPLEDLFRAHGEGPEAFGALISVRLRQPLAA